MADLEECNPSTSSVHQLLNKSFLDTLMTDKCQSCNWELSGILNPSSHLGKTYSQYTHTRTCERLCLLLPFCIFYFAGGK